MAAVSDLLSQLETVSISLKTSSEQTKSTELPADIAEKLENVIMKLQGIKGDVGGKQEAFVKAYHSLISDSVAVFLNLSNQIGGEVQEQAALLKNAFDAQFAFIVIASECKAPAQSALVQLLQPTSAALAAVQEYRETRRTSKVFNHLSAVSDGIPALGWVTVTPKPAPFVKEMGDAGQFYTNRVLKEYKEKDPKHVEWVRALMKIFKELHGYVMQYHTTGLVWNKQGKDAKPSAGPPPAPAGGPPPPPPPPPADLMASSAPSGDGDDNAHNALFAAINKGGDITQGLKKVTKDQQTHKNPVLRQGPKPFGAPKPFKPTAASKPKPKPTPKPTTAPAVKKDPKFELQDKKWIVEYYDNNPMIEVPVANMKQTVYVFKCTNSTIQVKGKVNSITLDGCKKVGLLLESALSAVDLINCQSVKIQVTEKVPIVNIDKTDGAMIYLSASSLDTQFVTAKSSEMNILVPQEDGEFKEFAVPEQFKTTWNGKRLHTECAEVVG